MRTERNPALRDSIRVFLFGGLGNQLFQLAAGLYAAEGRPLTLDARFARARTSGQQASDVGDFRLPPTVTLDQDPTRRSRATWGRLATEYLLASTVNDSTFYQARIANLAGAAIGRSLGVRSIHRSSGVGHDPDLHDIPGYTGIIGYFQSAQYAETLKLGLGGTESHLHTEPPWLATLREESHERNVTALHVRLTDYAESSMHRIATPSYYESAIRYIEDRNRIDSVWLFSDQPKAALDNLGVLLRNRDVRVVPDSAAGATPAQVLTAMSFGSSIVIPGSTFGWWGAFLGSQSKLVVCPAQWFHGAVDPEGLVPNDWVRMADGAHA